MADNHEHYHHEHNNGGSFVTGFIIGGIVGAAVGMLLAPKSGSEMRADLARRSESWRARAEEIAAMVRERMGPAMEGARERLGPAVEGMRERIGPVAERMGSRFGRAPEKATETNGGMRVSPDEPQTGAMRGE